MFADQLTIALYACMQATQRCQMSHQPDQTVYLASFLYSSTLTLYTVHAQLLWRGIGGTTCTFMCVYMTIDDYTSLIVLVLSNLLFIYLLQHLIAQ